MDLKEALGAREAASSQKFSIYLPDRDSENNEVPGFEAWVDAALALMIDINGGATKLPPAVGVWRSQGGAETRENTSIVYSFIRDPDGFESGIGQIAAFLHKFGRETGQGEVMVEFEGEQGDRYVSRSYFIDEYRPASAAVS